MRHALTILAVDDVERAAAFYLQALGAERAVRVPVYHELLCQGGQRLGLYQRGGFAINTGQTPAARPEAGTTATELYFLTDDLDAAIARLVGAGATPLSPRAPRPWGDEVAYFADPERNVVAVGRPLNG